MLISAANVIHQKTQAWVGNTCDLCFILYSYYWILSMPITLLMFSLSNKKIPPLDGGISIWDYFVLFSTTSKLVEFDDKTILWEGNAGANILGINHTDIELVAVVWLDI